MTGVLMGGGGESKQRECTQREHHMKIKAEIYEPKKYQRLPANYQKLRRKQGTDFSPRGFQKEQTLDTV